MASATRRPVLAALAALLVAALSVTGCVSMPTGGPVQSFPVTQQGAGAQGQPYVQVQPPAPRPGWSPQQIVQGFLLASASFGSYSKVVQQYLTPDEQKLWNTGWSAIVYKSGPDVGPPTYPVDVKSPTKATVVVGGSIQACLKGSGSYSLPSASSQGAASCAPDPFTLVKLNGQWRISSAPEELLLTSNSFSNDYQLSSLYFFDPMSKYLIPDPVYVPLAAKQGDLVNGLVRDLITPPVDWLSEGIEKNRGATQTAFPAGTKLIDVQLDGVTAVVNLTGTIAKANDPVMLRISAQLLSTLRNAAAGGPNGQVVQSVEVLRNGKPWNPPGSQDNPVQQSTRYHPAYSSSTDFYYTDSQGYLTRHPSGGGASARLAQIGKGFTQIAVSPDGTYVAALHGDTLYAGLVKGKLAKLGAGYVAMSWDASDNLWASRGERIVMFRGTPGARQPLGQMALVTVNSDSYINTPPYTLLKVAPDGVRVAIVQNSNKLTFGAISGQRGPNPQIWLSTVQDAPQTPVQSSPAIAYFTSLAWYDPDNVIALATPGPAVTLYPVSGGNTTSIPTDSDIETISASYKQPLVAGLSKGQMATDPSLTGSWMTVDAGDGPANGSAPVYPG